MSDYSVGRNKPMPPTTPNIGSAWDSMEKAVLGSASRFIDRNKGVVAHGMQQATRSLMAMPAPGRAKVAFGLLGMVGNLLTARDTAHAVGDWQSGKTTTPQLAKTLGQTVVTEVVSAKASAFVGRAMLPGPKNEAAQFVVGQASSKLTEASFQPIEKTALKMFNTVNSDTQLQTALRNFTFETAAQFDPGIGSTMDFRS